MGIHAAAASDSQFCSVKALPKQLALGLGLFSSATVTANKNTYETRKGVECWFMTNNFPEPPTPYITPLQRHLSGRGGPREP